MPSPRFSRRTARSWPSPLATTAGSTASISQAALTIAPGASAPTTVNITRTNFTGAVTLSLGNAPAGVTGSFSPAAPTGNSSTLTVNVAASVADGVYNLTVDGTGTPGNRSTPLTLTVSTAPDYALSLTPAALTIVQGTNGNTTVDITRSNFTGAVTLSLGGAPAGVTGSFNPAAPTGNSSTLTVSLAATVAPGTYNLAVDGAGTPGNRSTPLTLTVEAAPPDYTLSLSPAALTIVQGANGNTTVNIARTNFTGAVTLSLGNAPAGVTGSFNPAAPTGSSSVLTVSVGAAVTPGVYNLTVDGTGTPGNRSTPLTLTVNAAPADYALSLSPAALTIVQGANGNTTVNITRTNFTGAVTLSLGGAPAGVTGSFNPAAPTGNSSTLTVSVGASVATGVYNLTVDGTGTPGNRSTPLTLTVTSSGGGGNVTLNYANCAVEERPVWVAYQDGTGPWTRVTGTGDVYSFSITNSRYGLAGVFLTTAPSSSVEVQYVTLAEFSGTVDFCPTITPPTTKSINGTVAGVAGSVAVISLGGGTAFAFDGVPPFPDFVITGVLDGTHDLLALRRADATAPPDAVIIHRDQNIPNNGSVGTLDFSSAEAFAPGSATITVGGLVGGEMLTEGVTYHTGPSCLGSALNSVTVGTASFTAYGIPALQQRPSDFHSVNIFAQATNAFRSVSEYFHDLGARTVRLGDPLPGPMITDPGVSYKRLQAVYTLPADYQGFTSFGYDDQAGKAVSLFASFGYLGGLAVTLALPDFSALAGWDNNWPPASSSTVNWDLSAGSSFTVSSCTDSRFATLSGTF